VQTAGMGLVLILASAVIGVVWLSVAIAGMLAAWLNPPLAALATAGLFFLPPIIFSIALALRGRRARQAQEQSQQALAASPDLLVELTRIAQDMAARAPLAAVAVALLGGLLAARFPAALPLLVQALAQRETPQ